MKKLGLCFGLLFLALCAVAQPSRGLDVVASKISDTAPGRQIVVLIAVDRYKEWLPLRFPVRDAKRLKDVLEKRYWITDTIELYNEDATKAGIIRKLDTLAQELKPEDSILIYYAGHGHLDSVTDMGFWIPQDGGTDMYSQNNWLPNPQIRSLIGRMKARHIVLVSDSCFSGDILNASRGSPPAITEEYFKAAYARRSRQVLTSGASETVPDESLFTRSLIRTLEENDKPYIDPYMLFNEVRLSTGSTTPLLGSLTNTDHQDGGAFLLFLKDQKAISTPVKLTGPASLEIIADKETRIRFSGKGITRDGQGPMKIDSLKEGVYTVNASGTFFQNQTKTITIAPGQALSLDFRPGRFVLPAKMPGAQLEVDGKTIALLPVPGTHKFQSSALFPGTYSIKVTGEYPYSTTMELVANQNTELFAYQEYALSEATSKKSSYVSKLEAKKVKIRSGISSIAIGVLGTGGAVASWLLGQDARVAYEEAVDSASLMAAREQVELMQKLFIGSASAGGLGFIASSIFFSGSSKRSLEDSINKLDEDIKLLQGY